METFPQASRGSWSVEIFHLREWHLLYAAACKIYIGWSPENAFQTNTPPLFETGDAACRWI